MQRWADSAKVALPRHSRQRARLVSQVGGIPTAEMNSLELEFLFMINFTLNVTPEVYRYLRPIPCELLVRSWPLTRRRRVPAGNTSTS